MKTDLFLSAWWISTVLKNAFHRQDKLKLMADKDWTHWLQWRAMNAFTDVLILTFASFVCSICLSSCRHFQRTSWLNICFLTNPGRRSWPGVTAGSLAKTNCHAQLHVGKILMPLVATFGAMPRVVECRILDSWSSVNEMGKRWSCLSRNPSSQNDALTLFVNPFKDS